MKSRPDLFRILATSSVGMVLLLLLSQLDSELPLIGLLPFIPVAVAAVICWHRVRHPWCYVLSLGLAIGIAYVGVDSRLGLFSLPMPTDGQHYRIVADGESSLLVLGTFTLWPIFLLFRKPMP